MGILHKPYKHFRFLGNYNKYFLKICLHCSLAENKKMSCVFLRIYTWLTFSHDINGFAWGSLQGSQLLKVFTTKMYNRQMLFVKIHLLKVPTSRVERLQHHALWETEKKQELLYVPKIFYHGKINIIYLLKCIIHTILVYNWYLYFYKAC